MGCTKIVPGQHYGEWTVLGKASNNDPRYRRCRCSCGVERDVRASTLRSGQSTSCGHVDDLTNQQFGEWTVLWRAPSRNRTTYWHCRCSCGVERDVRADSLRFGLSKSCGHVYDLTNQQFGEWKVLWRAPSRNGIVYWHCRCSCGVEREVQASALRSGESTSCGHEKIVPGQRFGEWTVIERAPSRNGNTYWHCRCSCGVERDVRADHLQSGRSTSCGGHDRADDLKGQQFGEWTVLWRAPSRNEDTYWHCRCSCGAERDVLARSLRSGRSKSCGHEKDLTGQQFGEWTVLWRATSRNGATYWHCRCGCGIEKDVLGHHLIYGISKSCGHADDLTNQQFGEWTVLWRAPNHGKHVYWHCQCSCGVERDVRAGLLTSGHSKSCGHDTTCSYEEKEVLEYVKGFGVNVIERDRNVLKNGKEVDIYIPDINLAIEFNGVYWHSTDINDDIKYHYEKTRAAFRNGINLFHIWEWEWLHNREKIKRLLYGAIEGINIELQGNVEFKEVTTEECKEFVKKNSFSKKDIEAGDVAVGVYLNSELVTLMDFRRLPVGSEYEWELIDYCYKLENGRPINEVNLFNYFKDSHNVKSLVYLCPLDKFYKDNVETLDMNALKAEEPECIEVEKDTKYVISKDYHTKMGCNEEMDYGYLYIYDAGSIKYEWRLSESLAKAG